MNKYIESEYEVKYLQLYIYITLRIIYILRIDKMPFGGIAHKDYIESVWNIPPNGVLSFLRLKIKKNRC